VCVCVCVWAGVLCRGVCYSPGGSSTGFGNFEEIGPLDVSLQPRNTSWVTLTNVLFVDNPVGTLS